MFSNNLQGKNHIYELKGYSEHKYFFKDTQDINLGFWKESSESTPNNFGSVTKMSDVDI